MAKRSTSLDEILICLSGFALGALVATVMTGLPAGTQPELQKIKWRYETEDTLTGFVAGGYADNQSNRGMLR